VKAVLTFAAPQRRDSGTASAMPTQDIELPRIIAHNILWRNSRFSQKSKDTPERLEKRGLCPVLRGNRAGGVFRAGKKIQFRRLDALFPPVRLDKLP